LTGSLCPCLGDRSHSRPHEYSHKRIQNKQIRGLGRNTHAHMLCTYRDRHIQKTCIYTSAHTYTDTSGSTEVQETSRDADSSLVLAKVSQQDPYRRDGCAAHTSMVIYTSRERTDVDSHTHMRDTYIHSGQSEILLRVSSQTYNRRPLKGCLTLCAEIQKTAATPGDSDTHKCLYKTEPDLNQKCSEEEAG